MALLFLALGVVSGFGLGAVFALSAARRYALHQ